MPPGLLSAIVGSVAALSDDEIRIAAAGGVSVVAAAALACVLCLCYRHRRTSPPRRFNRFDSGSSADLSATPNRRVRRRDLNRVGPVIKRSTAEVSSTSTTAGAEGGVGAISDAADVSPSVYRDAVHERL